MRNKGNLAKTTENEPFLFKNVNPFSTSHFINMEILLIISHKIACLVMGIKQMIIQQFILYEKRNFPNLFVYKETKDAVSAISAMGVLYLSFG